MMSQSRKARRNSVMRQSRTRCAQFDVLEPRALLSGANPHVASLVSGQGIRTLSPRPESPLQPLKVSTAFVPGKQVESWKQQVNAGDNLAVSIQETNGVKNPVRIRVLGPNGRIVSRTKFSVNPDVYLEAQTTGTYTVQVIDPSPKLRLRDTVTVEVFGINKGTALPSAETDTGKRWAWLDGNALSIADPSGEGFQITSNWKETVQTDPATGMPYAIYTTSGPSTIKLSGSTNSPADQNLSITLDGPITVRTDPGLWGGHAGTIASTQFGTAPTAPAQTSVSTVARPSQASAVTVQPSASTAPSGLPTGVDANALFATFNTEFGLGITVPGTGFGMASGKQLMAMPSFSSVPLRPDGTYFYVQKNSGGSISFGGASATASGSETLTLILDPSDPFIYVAGGPIAFGASAKGLIPFVPQASSYNGPEFSGNLYGEINDIPIGNLPATASGSAVINLDPRHNGDVFNLNGNAATLFTKTGLNSALPNIDIGINGEVSVGTALGNVEFTVPVGNSTLGYKAPASQQELVLKPQYAGQVDYGLPATLPIDKLSGTSSIYKTLRYRIQSKKVLVGTFPNSDVYDVSSVATPAAFAVAGNTTDPFAGTPLQGYFNKGPQFTASFSSSGFTAADFKNNIEADFHANVGSLGGYNFGSIDFTANKNAVAFNAPVNVFLGRAQVSGNVNLKTGAFTASATFGGTSAASFLPFNSSVTQQSLTISLKNTPDRSGNPNFSLYANVTLGFQDSRNFSVPGWWVFPAIDLGNWGIYGNLTGTINIDPANTHYSGSVTASGGFILASQKTGGTINASLSNDAISVGATIDVSILGSYFIGFTVPL